MKKIARSCFTILLFIITGAASCEFSLIDENENGGLTAEEVNTEELQKSGSSTSQDLFSDFLEMVEEVRALSTEEIDSLSIKEVLELGEPVQTATSKTIYFDSKTLQDISKPIQKLTQNFSSLTENEHTLLSSTIEEILQSGLQSADGPRAKSSDEIREILKNWADDAESATPCADLFNTHENQVLVGPGENLNIANYTCESGSNFILRKGIYIEQSVLQSKEGNFWIGLTGAVMDGKDSIYRAFSGGLNQNRIAWIEFRNYHLHGIYSELPASNVYIRSSKFLNIAPDSTGRYYGAIRFDNSSNIRVTESRFENVASGVRFRFSEGPLVVLNNDALNSGRNFFQCDDCSGEGIRISQNSMIQTDQFGVELLEDWINLHNSEGDSTDWIQVNHNRARGHSLSGSGSFIMLGDGGGRFQEAVGNIGVNPGQVGIGIAGGHHIKVEANRMFSTAWDSSNVAFYSANFTLSSCGNHMFPGPESANPNRANWICGDRFNCNPPQMNHAWSDGKCGITNGQIRDSVLVDSSMGRGVWIDW